MNDFSVEAVRRDFPFLTQSDPPFAYLDNAATTQKPDYVINAIAVFYRGGCGNVHRGVHRLSERSTSMYEEARSCLARWIGASAPGTVVFTANATDGVNLVARSWGAEHLQPGDQILLTQTEHHSNMVPWQLVAREYGIECRYVPVCDKGQIDVEAYRAMLSEKVKLVGLSCRSNVLGNTLPVRQMIKAAKQYDVPVLVDAAQILPHERISVAELDCDWLVASAHKMLGPTGVGILYGKKARLESMPPWKGGGDMIRSVSFSSSSWAEPPTRFEAGTPNVAGAVGFKAAVEYLEKIGMDMVASHSERLGRLLADTLASIPGIHLLGRAPGTGGIVSFWHDVVHPHDIAEFANTDGVGVRSGNMCAQPLVERLGTGAVCRASCYLYNNEEELERFAVAVRKAVEYFAV